ncbi:MAG TPA: sodium:solute symporter, partial [Actinomycetota bacterium]
AHADRDRYLTARGTQGAGALTLSFFASALGTWILFAPPEVGTFGGLLGILGYAVGQAAAIAIFAWLGPLVRDRLPSGSTILGWVRGRFGPAASAVVVFVSVGYMFIFLTAELTAIGGVLGLLAGVDPLVPVLAVALATAAYTAYGGLPASVATDRWQGWLVLAFLAIAAGAVVVEIGSPVERLRAGGAGTVTRLGAETFVTLFIAIVAANLFHQGFWQRVWAARDRDGLVRGAIGGAALILPVVLATGLLGAMAAGAGRAETPSLAFFALLEGLPEPVLWIAVALAVALVASTTDTLQNGLASLAATEVGGRGISLGAARWLTVALTVPGAAIAVQGYSVLRLFLIADLLAAAIAAPVFLGLWRRATSTGVLAGAAAGIVGVVAAGWIATGDLLEGLRLLTLPPDRLDLRLGAFAAAAAASTAVALLVAVLSPRAEAPSPSAPRAGPPTRSSR